MKSGRLINPVYLISAIGLAPRFAHAEGVGTGKIGNFLWLVQITFFVAPLVIPVMAIVSWRLNQNLNNRSVAIWTSANLILAACVLLSAVIGFLVQAGFGFVVMVMLLSLCSFVSVMMALVVQWRLLRRVIEKKANEI
jgi:hypothetical protein